jgi:hypothetical protein
VRAGGTASDVVTVNSETFHVETESTQNGEVITRRKIEAVPLSGRSYTDLLSLQPGVVPSAYKNQAPDTTNRSPSGDLNADNQSVNRQREGANGFMVNGANVMEGRNNGTAIVPNLDSIEEFRIITNNFDAESGNYSGSQVNVATKSGTKVFHGSASNCCATRRLTLAISSTTSRVHPKVTSSKTSLGVPSVGPSGTTSYSFSRIIRVPVRLKGTRCRRTCRRRQIFPERLETPTFWTCFKPTGV